MARLQSSRGERQTRESGVSSAVDFEPDRRMKARLWSSDFSDVFRAASDESTGLFSFQSEICDENYR
jgi:hypothetical protein